MNTTTQQPSSTDIDTEIQKWIGTAATIANALVILILGLRSLDGKINFCDQLLRMCAQHQFEFYEFIMPNIGETEYVCTDVHFKRLKV